MLYTTVGGHGLVVRAGALNDYHAGENITIHFDMTKCHFFDAETGNSNLLNTGGRHSPRIIQGTIMKKLLPCTALVMCANGLRTGRGKEQLAL